ncbi:hypothetical protein Acsp05_58560 [Actinokineospora sp. NBRC 105648]|nr:hypothetical protein Acsp05_58560 [Actinokineospora sp. NBRC 105648]
MSGKSSSVGVAVAGSPSETNIKPAVTVALASMDISILTVSRYRPDGKPGHGTAAARIHDRLTSTVDHGSAGIFSFTQGASRATTDTTTWVAVRDVLRLRAR